MPRQARIGLPAQIYHVMNRGNNRGWIFEQEEDFRRYLDILLRYKKKEGFLLHHWVLMSNHVHLLMAIPEEGSLARAMQGINLSYALWFNLKYHRYGHLWQGRFKSFPVEKDLYLLECGRYIERNPLRAGLVSHPGDYPWSSFRSHADVHADGITDPHDVLTEQFGSGGSKAYRDFVCSNRDREEQELRERMNGGIIGGQLFQDSVRQAAVAARRPKRGRKRK